MDDYEWDDDDEDDDEDEEDDEIDDDESDDSLDDELDFDDDEQSGHDDVDAEASYVCDHCGEEIVVPLDVAAGREQSYVEDCPVCCSPNVIHVEFDDDGPRVWSEPE